MTHRTILALIASLLIASVPLSAHAQRVGSFDITGTVVDARGNTLLVLTSDIAGTPQVVTVDASEIRVSNIRIGDSLTLTVATKSSGILEAWVVVEQGSRTMENDFGARAEFETQNESSHVLNRADDDEARAKDKDRRGKED